jgi:hypothetical protein
MSTPTFDLDWMGTQGKVEFLVHMPKFWVISDPEMQMHLLVGFAMKELC